LTVCARITVGCPVVLGRRCGVELAVVVATALEAPDLVVGERIDHGPGARIPAEEVLPHVRAGLGLVGLEVAVRRGVHEVDQGAVGVGRQQLVPLPAPDHLDDVPAGAPEGGLQLLDDLAVAADRAVEALQIAVDHEGEVVELLAGRQPDRADRLRLVHLAVAEERPHPLPAGVPDPPMVQVPVEPGLVDRVDPAEAHGDRRELPEVGQQPRVRVGRQAGLAGELLAEPVELGGAHPPLDVRSRVHPRGGVPLDEDLITAAGVVLAPEEVVEPDLVQAGGAREAGDVPADADPRPLRPVHDHRGVPPDVGPDPPLDGLVAGEPRLALGRDRVDVVGRGERRHPDLPLAGALQQPEHQVSRALGAERVDDTVQRLDPLGGLLGVDVGQLAR
jgi:hypothetical protein